MSILVNKESKVLIQGITGTQASFHVKRSMDYGTNVVAGVTPGKGGSVHLDVPVFDTVREAIGETGANASVMYVPAKFVKDAVREAAEAELDLCVCIADGVPIKDMLEIKEMLRGAKTKLIGPNTPGIITPGEARLGIFRKTSIVRGVSASFRAHRPLPMKRSSKPTAPGWDNPRSSAWATTCSSALTLSKRSKSL